MFVALPGSLSLGRLSMWLGIGSPSTQLLWDDEESDSKSGEGRREVSEKKKKKRKKKGGGEGSDCAAGFQLGARGRSKVCVGPAALSGLLGHRVDSNPLTHSTHPGHKSTNVAERDPMITASCSIDSIPFAFRNKKALEQR